MADQPTEKPDAPAPQTETPAAPAGELEAKEEPKSEASDDKPAEGDSGDKTEAKTEEKNEAEEKVAAEGDSEMPDATEASIVADADQSTADASTKAGAKNQNRRKSTGGGRKSLSKKASKAKVTHLDAKPGDHFLVKLKGFPEWPAVICAESMLPQALLTSRPVTAARPDGTYAEPYADGGKRAYDRNFPVMYLHTNEFGWVVNTALTELTPEMAKSALEGKLRKDLKAAFELAAEHHPLDHYKQVLRNIEEEFQKAKKAREEAAATPKKGKKGKAKADDEDVDMADADGAKSKQKKRKADDDTSTPQRSDSVKKPKIKLNTSSTPKAANGATPQSKDASGKTKPKAKKTDKKEAAKEKLTPEERLARKEKEVLYLRYKLQRGLLNKEHPPKEDEMKQMSEYVTMLEKLPELEVSIIRATRINKVLKQIMKLGTIPREEDYKFKNRSQTLLDKWNQVMATDTTPAAAKPATNGVNGKAEPHAEGKESGEKEAEQAPEEKEKKSESAEAEKPADSEADPEAKADEAAEEKTAVEAGA